MPAPKQAAAGTGRGDDAMDHGEMNMQGGSPPPDARDPHAYSGGYTLESGPYALPGPRQLRLADEHNFGALLVDRLERRHGDGRGQHPGSSRQNRIRPQCRHARRHAAHQPRRS
ncbi:MAG: hypothetical protein M1449_12805, partial [Candidatus Thermoplasmatota archaeon]|nr:hypothetical protein [Candidatus Thermoplasmatota archaeon]